MKRISKLMSERGICSRREADRFIEQGLVFVDGQKVEALGQKADESVKITLKQEAQSDLNDQITIMLHKPIGYVSSQPEDDNRVAFELLTKQNFAGNPTELPPHLPDKIAPVGRLDIDSKGLLLLTENGRFAKKIIGPENTIEKEYLVRVEGPITKKKLELLCYGLELDNKKLKKAKISEIKPQVLKFVLNEGKKRQIRRMCELVELKVIWLKRIRIGSLTLGDLEESQWRFLSPDEISHF